MIVWSMITPNLNPPSQRLLTRLSAEAGFFCAGQSILAGADSHTSRDGQVHKCSTERWKVVVSKLHSGSIPGPRGDIAMNNEALSASQNDVCSGIALLYMGPAPTDAQVTMADRLAQTMENGDVEGAEYASALMLVSLVARKLSPESLEVAARLWTEAFGGRTHPGRTKRGSDIADSASVTPGSSGPHRGA